MDLNLRSARRSVRTRAPAEDTRMPQARTPTASAAAEAMSATAHSAEQGCAGALPILCPHRAPVQPCRGDFYAALVTAATAGMLVFAQARLANLVEVQP